VHERHAARAGEAPEAAGVGRPRRRDPPHPARRHHRPPQHGERADEHLDAGRAQIGAEETVLGQHDDRPVARRIEARRDGMELAVGAVERGARGEQQDGARAQTSTS
jgi:hypothetical protein